MALINCVGCDKPMLVTSASCLKCGNKKPFEQKVLTAQEVEAMTMGELESFRNLGGQVEWALKEKVEVVVLCVLMTFGMYMAYTMVFVY